MATQAQRETILFPVGRLVGGDLYKPNTTDTNGQPLIIKNGPNKGQTRQDYVVVVAIPKTPGVTHWAHESSADPAIGAWGMKLWQAAGIAWPQGQTQRRDFAWKIGDGDSTEIDKGGRRNVDKTGYPGNWIVKFGGGYAPQIFDSKGQAPIQGDGIVKRGHFIQVAGTYSSNESSQTPGMYLNHQVIAYAGFGEEIRSGPDPRALGFGASPLPAGATAIPAGGLPAPGAAPGFNIPPPGNPATPGMGMPPPGAAPGLPAPPAAYAPPMPQQGVAPPGLPPMPAAPGLPVQPNPAFPAAAAGMPPPPAPGLPPPPAAPVARRLHVTAPGHTQQSLNQMGHSDDQIVANGWGVWQ